MFSKERISSGTVALATNLPSHLEHMFEETRHDVRLVCFLLKICDKLEMGSIFSLVSCSGKGDINVFAGNPLVKVIFNLNEILGNKILEVIPKDKTYQSQYKSHRNHWEHVVLGELRVYNALIIFILEPDFVDKSLYQGGTKNAGFRYGILSAKILTVSSTNIV